MINIPQQAVLFQEIFSKTVSVRFSRDHLSSDGGAILLKAIDQRLGITQTIAETFIDRRQPDKVRHEIIDLTRQRIFSLASGYPDGNDAGRLKQDPVLKLMCDHDPIAGDDLGSQPTLSRFENSVTSAQMLNLSRHLAEKVLRHQRKQRRGDRRPKRVVIDLDPTCDPAHGRQQLTFFNGYYDTRCYLPLVVTVSFNKEQRKYPVAAVLRPGNAGALTGTWGVIKRLVPLIRSLFPSASLYFRADGAYCCPELLDWLEAESIHYTIPMGANSVLQRLSSEWMDMVRKTALFHGKSITIHQETRYQAHSWPLPRRVIYKAEVLVEETEYRDNARYIITNFPNNFGAEGIFRFYYGHSDLENTIKEFKLDLNLDRTSCSSFLANQLRVTWSLAAYILMQSLQERITDPKLNRATMGTLRLRLFKIAVRVKSSTRRVLFLLTAHYPWQDSWLVCAQSVGAVPG